MSDLRDETSDAEVDADVTAAADEAAADLEGNGGAVATPRTVARHAIVLPEVPGVAPEQVVKALSTVWRQSTDRDAPTLLQLVQQCRVERVDVDEASGYVSVVTRDDAYRALGVRREMVVPLVAMLTARAVGEVRRALAKGPAKITALEPRDAESTDP